MCSVARDTSRDHLLSPTLDASDDDDVISPAQDSIVSCTTRSGYTSYTSYTDFTQYTSSDRNTSAPSYTDIDYEHGSVSYTDSIRESENCRESESCRESEICKESESGRGSVSCRESENNTESIGRVESEILLESFSQMGTLKRSSVDRRGSEEQGNAHEKRESADGRGALQRKSIDVVKIVNLPASQLPLDPNWSMSSGSSFSDYTDSSVTLPSLHENGEVEEAEVPNPSDNLLIQPDLISQASSLDDDPVPSNPPSSGGLFGKLKGLAIIFVDKVLSDDKQNTELEVKSTGSNPDSSFKHMFRKDNSETSADNAKLDQIGANIAMRPVDTNTLLGMVKQYEEEKKTDPLLQEQDIPYLIRVEEGAILYRRGRESPGARSARSGKIGHGFRKHKLNADDSSALSAYSQISRMSSMGIVSLEEESEEKPNGARRRSTLGGGDKDVLAEINVPIDADDNFPDTLEKAPLNSVRFRDGLRQIDFVLSYRLDCSGGQAETKRRIYETNLRERGLELEHESAEHSSDNNTYYVKIHCPFYVLCDGAELMNLKLPFKEEERVRTSWASKIVPSCVSNHFCSPLDPLPQVYTTAFDQNKLNKIRFMSVRKLVDLCGLTHYYVGGADHDTLFSTSQRIQIVSGILQRTPHTAPSELRVKIGIQRLLDTDVYSSAFPLHDSTLIELSDLSEEEDKGAESDRQKLYRAWGTFVNWKRCQPLDHIRLYFGEKVSLYFCWLGFYTTWLIVPSVLGVVCFVYGVLTFNRNQIASGICENQENFLMCPRCDTCYFELLSCEGAKVAHLFDNNFTVAFSVFMSIWARLFLEFWKRTQSSKAFEWDTLGFEGQDEPPRPQYEQKATSTVVNPVTMKTEPSIPNTARYPRLASAFMVSLFMISLVIAAVLGVVVYRLAIRAVIAKTSLSNDIAVSSAIVSGTGAIANFLFILFMSTIYYRLAHFLTDWEMHRTQTEYEDALSFKMYMFQFVNFYSSIFYIAFVQGRFNGSPPNYNRLMGYRQEECSSYGCLLDLCIQLFVIMVGKQTIGNVLELGVPRLKVWLKSRSGEDVMSNFPNWDQECQLEPWPEDGLFDEYLEMVIQYGFITIFVACFPLAPVFALVNNIIEIRLDGNKILCSTRRCVPERAEDVGIWYSILERVSTLAVICNACIIAFTSEFIPRLVYMYTIDADLSNYADYTFGRCNISLLDLTEKARNSAGKLNMPNATECRFRMHFSTDPNNPAIWMQITAARLAFVIVFEHFVFFITSLVDWIIPDIPDHVQTAIEREKYLGKEALRAKEASPLEEKPAPKSSQPLSSLPEDPTEIRTPASGNCDTAANSFTDSKSASPPPADSYNRNYSLPANLPSHTNTHKPTSPVRPNSEHANSVHASTVPANSVIINCDRANSATTSKGKRPNRLSQTTSDNLSAISSSPSQLGRTISKDFTDLSELSKNIV